MNKKLYILLTTILVLSFGIFTNVYAESPVKININGKEVKTDVDPYIKNGRTMVPVRFISEALGAEVKYGEDKKYNFQWVYVRAKKDDLGLSMKIGYPIATISEGTYRTDVAPEIKNSRTMLPLRFIADYLCLDVNWDDATKTIYLTSKKEWSFGGLDKYFDEEASRKLGEWLMNQNKTHEQYMNIFK